jgi:hypothetical protein
MEVYIHQGVGHKHYMLKYFFIILNQLNNFD